MKAMNYESTKWSRDAIDDVVVDEETLGPARAGASGSSSPSWSSLLLAIVAVFMLGGSGEKAAAPKARGGRSSCRPSPSIVPGRQDVAGHHLRDRLARRAPRHAGRRRRRRRPGRARAGRARPVGRRRPGARRHRPLGPGAGGRAARRPDRGRARRSAASPRTSSTAPRRWSAAASSAKADLDRKRADPRRRRGPRPRRRRPSSARPAPASAGSTSARPTAGLVLDAQRRGRPGRRRRLAAPCSASPRAARWSCSPGCRRPISPGSRVGVPAHGDAGRLDPEPIRAASGRSRRSSIRRPARASPASRSPIIATLRPGGFASAPDPRRLDRRAAAARIGGAERRRRAITSTSSTPTTRSCAATSRIGEVSDRGVAIAAGLNGNERVVYSAGAFLNPGQKVRPERGAAPRDKPIRIGA